MTHLPSSYIVCHFEKSSSDASCNDVDEWSCEALFAALKDFGILLDSNRGGANERARPISGREGKQANRATDFKRGTLRSNEGDCFIPDCAKEGMESNRGNSDAKRK
jgi:hypothetical protein